MAVGVIRSFLSSFTPGNSMDNLLIVAVIILGCASIFFIAHGEYLETELREERLARTILVDRIENGVCEVPSFIQEMDR